MKSLLKSFHRVLDRIFENSEAVVIVGMDKEVFKEVSEECKRTGKSPARFALDSMKNELRRKNKK